MHNIIELRLFILGLSQKSKSDRNPNMIKEKVLMLHLSLSKFIFCLIFILGSARSFATSQDNTDKLRLEDLIQTALNQNPELRSVKAAFESQDAKIGPAGSLDDPTLSLHAVNIPEGSYRINEFEMSGIEVGLSQKIPFFGKRDKMREVADNKSKASMKRLEQKKLDVIRDVKKVYFDLYVKYQRKLILENQRAFVHQLVAASRNQYALNKTTQATVLNLQVDEASIIDEELKAESEIRDVQADLSHLVGHENHLVTAEPEKRSITKLDLNNWSEEKIARLVELNSSEILALRLEKNAGESALALAKKSYLPDFEISGNYTFRQPVQTASGTFSSGKNLVGAGISVSLPLYAGSKQSEQIKGAVADKAKADAELENSRLMLTHQARALFAKLKESKQRIELFESGLLQLTRQAVNSGRSSYLTGRLDYASFLESLRKQQNTEFGYQEAIAQFEIQLASLEALVGQKLGENSK